jgi:hypothetical protein
MRAKHIRVGHCPMALSNVNFRTTFVERVENSTRKGTGLIWLIDAKVSR